MSKNRRKSKKIILFLLILICISLAAFLHFGNSLHIFQDADGDSGSAAVSDNSEINQTLAELEFSGKPFEVINDNKPEFDKELKTKESFESYGALDALGRCTGALANLSTDTAPTEGEAREDIGMVHPTGWLSNQGWERCHLIGWQLCSENANANNLITGTHYLNTTGMLPFENQIASYIRNTGKHVLYRVTPVFDGENLIASGVHMEAESVEDRGEEVSFNVYCFNVTPGAQIDYVTGLVSREGDLKAESEPRVYVLNTSSMRFHYPSCSSVDDMSEKNKKTVKRKKNDLIREGYVPCGACEP